ncbi:UDP-N-acetylmuramoyl-tripeptide--D-alanyl-D-alanine ligase [Leptolyngbya sp. PCC 6406]|uniref:UDP-N-acetylmuramoyl-tripeptide--D-alanyl-D- alanine ligase n=1 Tax=Leptolyngbya sp. PCC 6406 TaxID=1173264 RepID=UPI0002ABEE9B|nr:UDP-N-acetylmuramoyl-tripeptide--D-alanyl-D-alanine ligase [Leptolyngbya sp. PCC 6406]
MAFQASLRDIAIALQGKFPPSVDIRQDIAVTGVSTDTRQIQPGDLFFALQGDSFDGHQFVAAALAAGAVAAVVQRPVVGTESCLLVPDTLAAYQRLAQWWRQRLAIPIVAITGSVGKTTTKELIAAALSTQGNVLKTRANYNNEIGVPKTLLELSPDHDFGVVEMGMRGPGEIALLTQIAQPTVAVITNVGTAHIGRLGSEQAIADAKCELLAQLAPEGIAVLNAENQRLMVTAAGVWSGRQISFGLTQGDVQGQEGPENTLLVDGLTIPLPLPGRHNALNYLAAIAVMRALDLDWTQLQTRIEVTLPAGRGRRLTLPEDIVILDETYNAGVESMQAALHLLAATPGQRRIAVLGTMKELGTHSLALHRQVGATVQQLGIDQLLILADPAEAETLAAGADPVPSLAFPDADSLTAHLRTLMQPGDRLLFKASRAVALDQVVATLLKGLPSLHNS